jgi:integrase
MYQACDKAGIGRFIPHDLRRSMAKDASHAGVDPLNIMDLGGWRSQAMFRRYRIKSAKRTSKALSQLQNYRAGLADTMRTNGVAGERSSRCKWL